MTEKLDLARVLRDIEDHLVPFLRLDNAERALYYHLLRHSRIEGKRVVQLSKRGLARSAGFGLASVHSRMRSLVQKGCLKILDRSFGGHFIELLTPDEIPGCVRPGPVSEALELEAADCFRNNRLRAAILRREQYSCFYCLRQLRAGAAVFDHAIPVAAGGDNSYRNVVACCFDCNSRKKDRPATEFLRELYRATRLSPAELDRRLAALEALQAGQLVPQLRLILDPAPDGETVGQFLSEAADADAKAKTGPV